MTDRKIWIGLPFVLLGGLALAIGFVPGVRNWFDATFPQFGINGPAVTVQTDKTQDVNPKSETSTTSPTVPGGSEQVLAKLPLEESPPALPFPTEPVQYAQATVPVQQQPSFPRTAQAPTRVLEAVPNGGIGVQGSASTGSIICRQAQIRFPLDVMVVAQADGLITQLLVDDGSFVKKDELMVELDSRLADSEQEIANQELRAAKLKAEDDSNVKYAQAAVKVAKAEKEISDDLALRGSESEMENRKKRLELIKAELQVTVSQSEKAQQAAQVAVNEAKLAASGVHIALRKIPAHFDGVISETAKRQFSFVRAGDLIFRLTSMEDVRVVGSAEPNIAPHLLLNAPARVTIVVPGVPDSPRVDGVVSYVSPRTQSRNVYQVYVNIKNQKLPDGQYLFREGMEATIEIMHGSR